MTAAACRGTTILRNAASEPHVRQLGEMLIKMGAEITGLDSNTIIIKGNPELHGAEVTILNDCSEFFQPIEMRVETAAPDDVSAGRVDGRFSASDGQRTRQQDGGSQRGTEAFGNFAFCDVFRVDPDRFPGTRDFGSEMLNDLEHDIRIADCGDIVHDDLLFREDGCRDHRQHRVLISADCDISGDFRSAVYDKAAHEICFPYGLG